MFVHVAIEHGDGSLPLIAKLAPPFDGSPGDRVGLQIEGTTHFFGDDGARMTSGPAALRSPGALSHS